MKSKWSSTDSWLESSALHVWFENLVFSNIKVIACKTNLSHNTQHYWKKEFIADFNACGSRYNKITYMKFLILLIRGNTGQGLVYKSCVPLLNDHEMFYGYFFWIKYYKTLLKGNVILAFILSKTSKPVKRFWITVLFIKMCSEQFSNIAIQYI